MYPQLVTGKLDVYNGSFSSNLYAFWVRFQIFNFMWNMLGRKSDSREQLSED